MTVPRPSGMLLGAVLVGATLLMGAPAFAAPGPDVPTLVTNPDSGPVASTIAVTAHFPYAECPMKGDPKVRFQWDGVPLVTAPMHGRCDVAVTMTPPTNASPGVHAIDAIVNDGTRDLTARGLFTVEPVAAALSPSDDVSTTAVAGRPHSTAPPTGALCLIGLAVLVMIGVLRWRRASRRGRYPDVGPEDRWISK